MMNRLLLDFRYCGGLAYHKFRSLRNYVTTGEWIIITLLLFVLGDTSQFSTLYNIAAWTSLIVGVTRN